MSRALASVVLLLVQTAPAKWPKEPLTYRGVSFGATVEQASKLIELNCGPRAISQDAGDRECFSELFVGDVHVGDVLLFREERFVSATMAFESEDYGKMKAIFIDKYGPPGATLRSLLQNGFGATFEGETLIWKGKRLGLFVQRYATADLKHGSAVLASSSLIDDAIRTEKETRKRARQAF